MTSTETRASATAKLPPISWFRDPELTEPTPITITADGRVFGHIAAWDAQHTSFPGRNVRPPRSRSDYGHFHVGSAEVAGDDGEATEISVGKLCMNAGHAPLTADAEDAQSFYDSTASIAALVCAGEDASGVWFSGMLEPTLDEVSRRRFRAGAVSGDWRSVNGGPLDLIAASVVPVPGFNIPRARVASAAEAADLIPLVAAGVVVPARTQETPMPDTDTPESLTAASPFAKGEPAPPSGDEGGSGFDSGDTVTIGDTDMVGQVVTSADDGSIVVELTVPADLLEHADDEDAMAASARFTDRMADRKRDADISKLTAALSTVTAALEASQETTAARDAKLDELLAKQRSQEFDRLVASAELD